MSIDTEPIRARLAKATPGPWCRHMIPGGDSIDGPDGTFDPTGEIMPAWDDGEHDCAIARGVYDGDADLIAHAPTDIAALLSEVDRLTAENEALRAERALSVAVCPDCGEVTKCDEDRCCVSCGRDLIVLADRHSADLVSDLTGENEGLHAELKTAQSDLACFKEDLRHVQVTLDQLRYRIERRDIY